MSFQTVAELHYGARRAGWQTRRIRELDTEIKRYTVVGYNIGIVEKWAELRAASEAIGHNVLVGDAWVAATALYLDSPVVTHNFGDFSGIPALTVISESVGPRRLEMRRR